MASLVTLIRVSTDRNSLCVNKTHKYFEKRHVNIDEAIHVSSSFIIHSNVTFGNAVFVFPTGNHISFHL